MGKVDHAHQVERRKEICNKRKGNVDPQDLFPNQKLVRFDRNRDQYRDRNQRDQY